MTTLALVTCRAMPTGYFDDAPLRAALEAAGARVVTPAWDDPAVAWGELDAVLIRSTWDYVPRRDEFVAWAAAVEASTRLFNPAAVVRANTHKSYLRRLEQRGARIVPTVWFRPGEAAPSAEALGELLRERGWGRAVLKPVVGATASGALPFAADEAGLAAAAAHAAALLREGEALLQPYLARVEVDGERSLVFVEGRPTHALVKRPAPGDYRTQEEFGAREAPHAPTAEEAELARAALRALAAEDLLYARVDLLLDPDGRPCVGEVELVEPALFFRHGPGAAEALAEALLRRVRGD